MSTSFSVVCYKSKTLKNGENPLMLQVCRNGKRHYQSLGVSINPKFWDIKKNRLKSNCPNKEIIQKIINDKLAELQNRILELSAERKEFTATTILNEGKRKLELATVDDFYQELIAQFTTEGKCGNRLIYKGSYNSLYTFTRGKLDIPFSDIDVDWLKRYEKWLRSKNNKDTTISLLFRTLRSTYNKAIKAKCARKSDYPFYEYKINKFDTRTQKRAIPKTDVLKFMQDVESNQPYVQLSKDVFVFSYFCGGINFTDMAQLTTSNIVEGRLHYVRQKTGKQVKIGIPYEAMAIIKKYESDSNGYLFPILDRKIHKTPMQKQNRIHKVLAKVNKNLKMLSEQLGVNGNITTYVARHSFASVLKKSGVNIALISEALGHSDLGTTQIYLDSFDNEQMDEAMRNLL